ncbi:tetratricopeptide repeat protein [Streptomyces sp. NPDC051183]|uniref:tetratricopeptide repeat protein n=1 Tax=Streptomyces sp. NPDC051183 TaxID=3155165 RepID=UPI0034173F8D
MAFRKPKPAPEPEPGSGSEPAQWARAEGSARITQVAGDYVRYEPGAGPLPPTLLGLPEAPEVLFGRGAAVEELLTLLGDADGGAPVVVVAGLAGVGKTALAATIAHRAAELGWFGDRVLSLPLRGYAPDGGLTGARAVQEMLRLLGVRDADQPPSPEGRLALYRARLAAYARAGQRVLVVADDAGSVEQVRDLVPAGDGHRLLVTSRDWLVFPGFAAQRVGLDVLAAGPAAQLLAGALRSAWRGDPRPEREPAALAGIAEHCGRLPLALTVAGALLAGDPGLPAAELAGQLAETRTRLATLTFEDGDVPLGVRAAFDLSYARLPEEQARIFRLLTVNPGPDCSTAHAALLTGEAVGLRRKLAALVRASLLAEQPLGSGRWRMHDLVRLYAAERGEEYAEHDGREGVIDAFLAGLVHDTRASAEVLGLDGRRATGPGLPSLEAAVRGLDSERATLTAAVGFAVERGRPAAALELAGLLGPYLHLYRHTQDSIAVARQVLAVAREGGSREAVGAALYDLGLVLVDGYEVAEAAERLDEALGIFRAGSHRRGEGKALNLLGTLHGMAHSFEEARVAFEGALEIFRELRIPHAEGTALAGFANVLERLGRQDEAIDAYRRSVALVASVGDRHRAAFGLDHLADALRTAGRHEESLAVREQALAAVRELGNRSMEAWVLNGISVSLLDEGRADEALARLEVALALFAEAGDRHGEGSTLSNLGRLHREAGRPAEALAAHERACALLAGTGDRHNESVAVRDLAITLAALDRPAEAAEAFDRAADLFAAAGDTEAEALCRAVGGGPGA